MNIQYAAPTSVRGRQRAAREERVVRALVEPHRDPDQRAGGDDERDAGRDRVDLPGGGDAQHPRRDQAQPADRKPRLPSRIARRRHVAPAQRADQQRDGDRGPEGAPATTRWRRRSRPRPVPIIAGRDPGRVDQGEDAPAQRAFVDLAHQRHRLRQQQPAAESLQQLAGEQETPSTAPARPPRCRRRRRGRRRHSRGAVRGRREPAFRSPRRRWCRSGTSSRARRNTPRRRYPRSPTA